MTRATDDTTDDTDDTSNRPRATTASEAPDVTERWTADELESLGLELAHDRDVHREVIQRLGDLLDDTAATVSVAGYHQGCNDVANIYIEEGCIGAAALDHYGLQFTKVYGADGSTTVGIPL